MYLFLNEILKYYFRDNWLIFLNWYHVKVMPSSSDVLAFLFLIFVFLFFVISFLFLSKKRQQSEHALCVVSWLYMHDAWLESIRKE